MLIFGLLIEPEKPLRGGVIIQFPYTLIPMDLRNLYLKRKQMSSREGTWPN